MAEFNAFYDARVFQLPNRLSEMLESPAWVEIMAAADKVLHANSWVDIEARYER